MFFIGLVMAVMVSSMEVVLFNPNFYGMFDQIDKLNIFLLGYGILLNYWFLLMDVVYFVIGVIIHHGKRKGIGLMLIKIQN
jgi:hypothetical protein